MDDKAPPPESRLWNLSHGDGFDVDMLRTLIEERNFHFEQIMAVNGRLGWVILALVASVFVGGEDLRHSLHVHPSPFTLAMVGMSGFFLILAIGLTMTAVIEHWRVRMVWVRRFERVIECYTHGMTIENALAEGEKVMSTRPGGPNWPGLDSASGRPPLFSGHPDLRPCEFHASYRELNSHMRFGLAAGTYVLSAFFFTLVVLS